MSMPQEGRTTKSLAEEQFGIVPANMERVVQVGVAGDLIEQYLTNKLANYPYVLKRMEAGLPELMNQMAAGAREACVPAPDAKAPLTKAPAIIIPRSIGEFIRRGDLVSGQQIPGQEGYFLTVWEPTNRNGEKLGESFAYTILPENLSSIPLRFGENVGLLQSYTTLHGYPVWHFDPKHYGTQSYQEGRFMAYQAGNLGLGMPELELVKGENFYANKVISLSMVALHHRERLSNGEDNPFYRKIVSTSDSLNAKCLQTLTEGSRLWPSVYTVCVPSDVVSYERKHGISGRSCARPVMPQRLNTLIK